MRFVWRFFQSISVTWFVLAFIPAILFADNGLDGELTPLERQLTLKLRTAARVGRNLGKIFGRIPWASYELFRSIRLLDEYLRSGGSLLDCLEDLPGLAFLSLERQITGIMGSMEEHLPGHLVPAISLIARTLADSASIPDANDLYRPDFGPLRVDLFDGLTLGEVREAALPSSYATPIYKSKTNWPRMLGDVCAMIFEKRIGPRGALLAHLIENLRVEGAAFSPPPAARESMARVVEDLLRGKPVLETKPSLDPYDLVRNVLISLERNTSRLRDTSLLRAHLQASGTRTTLCSRYSLGSATPSFQIGNGTIDYARLFQLDDELPKSKSASVLLRLVANDSGVTETAAATTTKTTIPFYPLEYDSSRDLLLAVVSRLRRVRPSLDSPEAIYGVLSVKSSRKRWGSLRSGRYTRTVLRALARRTFAREQRLYAEVAAKLEGIALVEDVPSSVRLGGPLTAIFRALRGLMNGQEMVALRAAPTIEQLLARQGELEEARTGCVNSILAASFIRGEGNATKPKPKPKPEPKPRLDVADLLQALPTLDLYSEEYKNFEAFLSRDTLQEDLDLRGIRPAIEEYPTRGRFLYWVLSAIEASANVSEKLRRLAGKFIDSVAYEGYGAGPVHLQQPEN